MDDMRLSSNNLLNNITATIQAEPKLVLYTPAPTALGVNSLA